MWLVHFLSTVVACKIVLFYYPCPMVAQDFFNPQPGPKCSEELSDTIFDGTVGRCSLDSTFSFWFITKPPSEGQITLICDSVECQELIKRMRAVRAPTECVMRDGYYLHQDILNPITTKCPNGAPIVTAPPTTKPAPVTDEPPSVGTINETSPWGTPAPADAWNPAPVTPSPTKASYVSSVSSSNDSGFRIGAVIGILFGVIFRLAFVMWLRQKNKRDPSMQKNQRLSYSDVGDFDTVQSSAPTYAPTAEYSNCGRSAWRGDRLRWSGFSRRGHAG